MKHFALNLVLALLWGALFGFGWSQLAAGFVIGLLVLATGRAFLATDAYLRAVEGSLRLIGFFAVSLLVASVQLAHNVLRPTPRFRPAIFRVDTRLLSTSQTVLFAVLTSLTPGTLTVDVEPAGGGVYVHALFAEDEQKARHNMERYAELIVRASGAASPSEGKESRWRRLLH